MEELGSSGAFYSRPCAEPHAAGSDFLNVSTYAEPVTAAQAHGLAGMGNPGAVQRLQLDARVNASQLGGGPSSARGTPGSSVVSKAAQDGLIMAGVRRQMETLDDKLSGQIARVQQHCEQQRDIALSRVESKMTALEVLQPKLDCRVAELSGSYKGLSDEMQAQIRRIDVVDSRLWEWRHVLEEEIRTKFAELEQSCQHLSSGLRVAGATHEEERKRLQKRVARIETMVEERIQHAEDTSENIVNLHTRLTEFEDLHSKDSHSRNRDLQLVMPSKGSEIAGQGELLKNDPHVQTLAQKIEHLQEQQLEMQGRLETQEERVKVLRTLHDTKDANIRALTDRVERADWSGRLNQLEKLVHDLDEQRGHHSEQLVLLDQKVKATEDAHEGLSNQLQRSRHQHADEAFKALPMPPEAGAVQDPLGSGAHAEALVADVRSCMDQMKDAEEKLRAATEELQFHRSHAELGPRVGALIEQLKVVLPKVHDHEVCLREMHEKIGRLDVDVGNLKMDRNVSAARITPDPQASHVAAKPDSGMLVAENGEKS